jgi:hypothetical protein
MLLVDALNHIIDDGIEAARLESAAYPPIAAVRGGRRQRSR